jgi:hypothetical protein
MPRRLTTLALIAAALAAPACKRNARTPCPFDLGGVWVNASDERYGYRLADDGTRVTGEFFLRQPSGAATPRATGEAPVTFSLRRDGTRLEGTMRSSAASRSGKPCEVDFAVRFSSCTPEQLQVVSEMSAPLDDACRRIRDLPDGGAVPPDLAEFVWVRSR